LPDALRNPAGGVRSFPAGRAFSRLWRGCLLSIGLFFCGAAVALLVLAFVGCRRDYRRVPPPIAPDSPDLSYLPGLDHEQPTYQPAPAAVGAAAELRQVNPGARDQRDYSAENRQWLAVRGRWFLAVAGALLAIGFGLGLATTNPLLDFIANIGAHIGLVGCGVGLGFMMLAEWWVWVSIGVLLLVAASVAYRIYRSRTRKRRIAG
jgi:hypothetical protein